MSDNREQIKALPPSWLRWPPNSCETCEGPWVKTKDERWLGECQKHDSLQFGTTTDARYRCQAFVRKPGV